MVDFQSRDTRRAVDDEDSEESTNEADDEAAGTPSDSGDDGGSADGPETEDTDVRITGERTVSVAILVADEGAHPAADAVADGLAGEHEVLGRDERTGDHDAIQTAVNTFLDQETVDAVVTVGGVGVGPKQVAVEAVEPLLDTTLPGFGELFRRRQADAVGTRAIRTRALAGLSDGTPVICLPGKADAATVATEELLVPELDWLATAAEGG